MEQAPHPLFSLAAAAVIVAEATVVIGSGIIATAAEQNQQDDDPAPVPTAKTIIIHKRYLLEFFHGIAAHSKIFRCQKIVQPFYLSYNRRLPSLFS